MVHAAAGRDPKEADPAEVGLEVGDAVLHLDRPCGPRVERRVDLAAAGVDDAAAVAHRDGPVAGAHLRRRPDEGSADELSVGLRVAELEPCRGGLRDHPHLLPERRSPEIQARSPGVEYEPGARHVTDGDAIGVIDDAAIGLHPESIRLAGEGIGERRQVRVAVAGDSGAHLGGGGHGPRDDRGVLRLELGALSRVDADKEPAAVVRIRLAADEPRPLESVEHAGHRAAREVAELRKPRRRHLRLAARRARGIAGRSR